MRPRMLLAALGLALIVVVGMLPFSAHARFGHWIDLSLSRHGRHTVGVGERSLRPGDQTMGITIRPYGTKRVTLGIQKKDESSPKSASIEECDDAGRLGVRYVYDGIDVSDDVKGHGILTEALQRGERVAMVVVFTARGSLVGPVSCAIESGRYDSVRVVVAGR